MAPAPPLPVRPRQPRRSTVPWQCTRGWRRQRLVAMHGGEAESHWSAGAREPCREQDGRHEAWGVYAIVARGIQRTSGIRAGPGPQSARAETC